MSDHLRGYRKAGLMAAAVRYFDELKQARADLAEAVEAMRMMEDALEVAVEWAGQVSDEFLEGEGGTRARYAGDLQTCREIRAQARAILSKHPKPPVSSHA